MRRKPSLGYLFSGAMIAILGVVVAMASREDILGGGPMVVLLLVVGTVPLAGAVWSAALHR